MKFSSSLMLKWIFVVLQLLRCTILTEIDMQTSCIPKTRRLHLDWLLHSLCACLIYLSIHFLIHKFFTLHDFFFCLDTERGDSRQSITSTTKKKLVVGKHQTTFHNINISKCKKGVFLKCHTRWYLFYVDIIIVEKLINIEIIKNLL